MGVLLAFVQLSFRNNHSVGNNEIHGGGVVENLSYIIMKGV